MRKYALLAFIVIFSNLSSISASDAAGDFKVVAIGTKGIVLNAGSKAGVRQGMKGTVFYFDISGEKKIKLRIAKFIVTHADYESSSASIIERTEEVKPDYLIEFDEILVPPKAQIKTVRENEPETLPSKVTVKGTLRILTEPAGANIYIDGKLTPSLEKGILLAPGSYKVMVSQPGFVEVKESVLVVSNVLLQKKYNLDLSPETKSTPDMTAPARTNPEPQPRAAIPLQPATPVPMISPQEAYSMAYQDLDKGNYDLAIERFTLYAQQYPASPLADNALYWIGHCRFSQRRFGEAIDAFIELILTYPKGDKAAAAYLKKALSFIELGQEAEALAALKVLVAKHPLDGESKIAKDMIRKLTKSRDNAIDPVCGKTVVKARAKATFKYKGATYYFCSTGCKEAFAKDPRKYLKAVKNELVYSKIC